MPKVLNYKIVIEQDEDEKFVASAPAIPGCYTEGDTYEEALKNIKEAIKLCLDVAKDDTDFASKINLDNHSKFIGITEVNISA